jgi:hypothetical protein
MHESEKIYQVLMFSGCENVVYMFYILDQMDGEKHSNTHAHTALVMKISHESRVTPI